MVAFHYPPFRGSSGVQRTLRFSQYLPDFDWQPLVLTADPVAYERQSDDLLGDIRDGTVFERAFARDTARHFSIKGRYPDQLAMPDRWVCWMLGAVPRGWSMIRRFRPDVIWSTYPIATAHRIGAVLHRLSGIPWVADFRDPMVEYVERQARWVPADSRLRKARLSVEGEAVKRKLRRDLHLRCPADSSRALP